MSPNFLERLVVATGPSEVEAFRRALEPLPEKLIERAFESTGCRVFISPAPLELRRAFGSQHGLHFGPRPDLLGESWEHYPFFSWGSQLGTYIHLPADTLDPTRALTIHEVGGHLVDFAFSNGRYHNAPWHRDAPPMQEPLDPYAADEYERWACAVQAYCANDRELPTCNRGHLRAREPELYDYITAFLARWR